MNNNNNISTHAILSAVPSELANLPSDSMADLAGAVALSIWYSVPEQPLQRLKEYHYQGHTLLSSSSSLLSLSLQQQQQHAPTPPSSPSLSSSTCTTSTTSSSIHCHPDSPFSSAVQVLRTILAVTKLSPAVILVATLYVARLRNLVRHTVQATGSEVRVLTVALILAAKWLEDHTYANASWALVSGMSARDLGIMEFEYLALLQWDLSVTVSQFSTWISTIMMAATFVFSPVFLTFSSPISPLSSPSSPAISSLSLPLSSTSPLSYSSLASTSPLSSSSLSANTTITSTSNMLLPYFHYNDFLYHSPYFNNIFPVPNV